MPLVISDEKLRDAGVTEDEARLELACRLFDAGKLTLVHAARWAGVDRGTLEDALLDRGLPIYRPTLRDIEVDLATVEQLGKL